MIATMPVRATEVDHHTHVWMPGHYGESRVAVDHEVSYLLGAGHTDTVEYFDTPHGKAVLTRNWRLRYVGVGLLDPEHHDRTEVYGVPYVRERTVVFFQDTHPDQIGPKDTFDYADHTIVRRALEGFVP